MRVLLLTNMYPSEREPGYGSFVLRQRERLEAEHGIEFTLVASRMRGGGWRNLAKYAALLARTIAATARGGYDLVHAHYLLPVAAFSLIPAVVRGKPLVITAHGTDIYSGQRPGWKRPIARALRHACQVLVVSRFLARDLAEGFGLTEFEPVIANMGVDTALFSPGDRDEAKRRRHIEPDTVHLVFVGNFVEQKGVDDLARALVELDRRGCAFVATLLGHGPYRDEVVRITEPLGAKVRLESVVPHEHLVDLFRSADLFVLPSRREGVGLLVCLESLACGVPVVASDAGGLPEIVKDGENGALFAAGDPAALADALERLIGDPQARAGLAAATRESALPYDESAQSARVAEVYAQCARLRGVRAL